MRYAVCRRHFGASPGPAYAGQSPQNHLDRHPTTCHVGRATWATEPARCPSEVVVTHPRQVEGATVSSVDTFGSKGTLEVGENSYEIFRLSAVEGAQRLPYSLKILAENLLRTEDGANITADHVRAIAAW